MINPKSEKLRKQTRKAQERMRDLKIEFDDPEFYVGMKITKSKTVSICTEVNLNERGYIVLLWESVLKSTNEKMICRTDYPLYVKNLPSSHTAFKNFKNKKAKQND